MPNGSDMPPGYGETAKLRREFEELQKQMPTLPLIPGGMTLRDWFAGQLLAACAKNFDPEEAAEFAYRYADAMLAERTKK